MEIYINMYILTAKMNVDTSSSISLSFRSRPSIVAVSKVSKNAFGWRLPYGARSFIVSISELLFTPSFLDIVSASTSLLLRITYEKTHSNKNISFQLFKIYFFKFYQSAPPYLMTVKYAMLFGVPHNHRWIYARCQIASMHCIYGCIRMHWYYNYDNIKKKYSFLVIEFCPPLFGHTLCVLIKIRLVLLKYKIDFTHEMHQLCSNRDCPMHWPLLPSPCLQWKISHCNLFSTMLL